MERRLDSKGPCTIGGDKWEQEPVAPEIKVQDVGCARIEAKCRLLKGGARRRRVARRVNNTLGRGGGTERQNKPQK